MKRGGKHTASERNRRTTKRATDDAPAARRSTPGTFTPEKKTAFLALYASGKSIFDSATEVGVSSVTVFNHVRSDEEFAALYRKAVEANTDNLEDHLYRMAFNKMPGNILAVFGILKARRPEKWRETAKVEHSGKIEFTRAEDLEAARQRARLRGAEAVN